MTTDPGDLVLDPTCGSGTTAYVAEQWGRRWITIDTSRVPLALARQRLLTATFPYYELQDDDAWPGWRLRLQAQAEQEGRGGRRDRPARHAQVASRTTSRRRRRCSSIGRRSTRRSRASPARSSSRRRSRRRSTGTATATRTRRERAQDDGSFVDRMLEALRRNRRSCSSAAARRSSLENVRPPAKSLTLSAEARARSRRRTAGRDRVRARERRGQREARLRGRARGAPRSYDAALRHRLRDRAERARARRARSRRHGRHPGDLRPGDARPVMGDLLKNMRSSQIFSVCGPAGRSRIRKVEPEETGRRRTRYRGRAARARHVRPDDDGGRASRAATTCRPGSSTPTTTACRSTSRRRSSRARARGTTCKKALKTELRGVGLGPPRRARRARRSTAGEHRRDRRQGDRRPRQRAARRQAARRGVSELPSRSPSRSSTRRSRSRREHWQIEEGRAPEKLTGRRRGRLLLPRPEGARPSAGAPRAASGSRAARSST